jgi:uncharacterized damage-inducible protein DinB
MTSHSLAHHFLTDAFQNAWANHRLLRACSRLSKEEFAATRTSFFPSIKATLNHILTVDWYYFEILERSDEFFCTNEDKFRAQDFAELGFTEERIWGERAKAP